MYIAYKHLHLLLVALSVGLLFLRFGLSFYNKALLQKKFLKIAPHVVDTFLLLSGVMLMLTLQQYPFVHGWLTEKFIAIIAYILTGFMALKGRTTFIRWMCFLGALGWLGLILRVASTKMPVFLPL